MFKRWKIFSFKQHNVGLSLIIGTGTIESRFFYSKILTLKENSKYKVVYSINRGGMILESKKEVCMGVTKLFKSSVKHIEQYFYSDCLSHEGMNLSNHILYYFHFYLQKAFFILFRFVGLFLNATPGTRSQESYRCQKCCRYNPRRYLFQG